MYGSVGTIISYKKPTITCLVSAYICNYSGGLDAWPDIIKEVRFYFSPRSAVKAPGGHTVVNRTGEKEGFLDSYWQQNPINPPYWWISMHHHRFNLRGGVEGDYTAESESVLEAKYDLDGDGIREEDDWTTRIEGQIFNYPDD